MVRGENRMKLTWKIWLMLTFLVFSVFFIFNLQSLTTTGVIVKSVDQNSSAFDSGLRKGEIIININEEEIKNFEDYSRVITNLFDGKETTKLAITTSNSQYVIFTNEIPKITVSDIPKTNIQAGLDLQGGARALILPEKQLTNDEMQDLISVSAERLNVYGISDVSIRPVSDLQGTSYMLVEIAGATPNDIENLISQQGKFEAKIGNETVFTGGSNDLTYVCRNDANCAGISACQPASSEQWFCNYEFTINLNEEAARRHAEITRDLGDDLSNPDI